ncbi:ferrous iron transport protein A [Niabella sp. CC-SYL272]|uniref:FeoA family protein n=1 Tax=Niabella agricola TaxID=2891571 RepID=UPI001F2DB3E8|nr:FeoA family protein [Niabella agricola]MCF3110595.1 ferrous iron transport protein A [Niabella agricola]
MEQQKELLLSDLKPGQRARIQKFTTEEIFLKLMEMGCLPGEEIEIIKIAPLNDPISISVAGYTLSLRLDEARFIVVSTINY